MSESMSKIKKIIEMAENDLKLTDMESVIDRSLQPKVDLMKREFDIYVAGVEGKVPKGWEKYEKKYERITDPEYKEFLRMKKKFE